MARTYKREVAVVLLVYLMYLGVMDATSVLEIVIWPFMLFVGAAFGMDWAAKQTDLTSRKENGK
jgi:hypothetical protein